MPLEKELETYYRNKDNLIVENKGKFVLIKDSQIVGVYTSSEDALTAGLQKFGNVPFLIKEIEIDDSAHFFYSGVAL